MESLVSIDLADPTYGTLAQFAGRIAKLIGVDAVQSDPNVVGCLDDLLGAVFALIFAKQGEFADRLDKPIEIAAVLKRADQIKGGKVRVDGKWMAGFHFNSALFRAAAVYHRILKVAVGKPTTREHVSDLRTRVKSLYRQWKNATWSDEQIYAVHVQVNTLKHTPRGAHDRRTVTYTDAVAGVGELLQLIEAWKGR